jgi:serine/threonine-protein kinase
MRRAKDGKLFLIDFGTVKQQIPTEIVTIAGEVKSQFAFTSEGYTPYEQLKLKPKLASDIYALGMMVIFALTGIPPNQIPEDRETGQFKWRDRISLNPKLADIIDNMVRHDYRDRYPSAIQARQALQEFLNPVIIPPSPPVKPKFSGFKKIIATTALLFTLGGGYYLWQQNQQPVLLTYENTEYGIEMEYPDDWVLEKVEDPFGTVARLYPEQDTSVEVTLEAIEIDSIAVQNELRTIRAICFFGSR